MQIASRPLFALVALTLASLLALAGCEPDRGDKRMGDACGGDLECREGLCVGGVAGDPPACTKSCGRAEDCPEGWSCSAVTANQVLVCRRGPATPFGQ